MRRLRVRAAAAAAVVVCAVSCGGDGSSSPVSPSSGSAGAVTITIMRQNGAQSFSPNPASAGGQTVAFRNADSVVHRVTLNDGTIDTGDLAPGATSRSFVMPTSGTNYHCLLHPEMIGAVNGAGGSAPPPCEGAYCGGGY